MLLLTTMACITVCVRAKHAPSQPGNLLYPHITAPTLSTCPLPAGYHRYSASWMGGNEAGIHSFVGLHAAMCGKQQQCPQVQPCAPAPKCPVCPAQPLCAPQPCMPSGQQQPAAEGAGAGGKENPASSSSGSSSSSDGSGGGSSSSCGGGSNNSGSSTPPRPKPLSSLRVRGELGPLLEREKLQVGAELGVKVSWHASGLVGAGESALNVVAIGTKRGCPAVAHIAAIVCRQQNACSRSCAAPPDKSACTSLADGRIFGAAAAGLALLRPPPCTTTTLPHIVFFPLL